MADVSTAPGPRAGATDDERAGWLGAATAIADHLCAAARWEGDACTWAAGAGPSAPAVDGRVGDGSAGVALFLAQLHRTTGAERYLSTARAALTHSLARERDGAAAAGWYRGTAGVAAACAELGSVAGDARWLDHAVALCRALVAAPPGDRADVAGGHAGSVLGLLRVHELTREGSLLASAARLGGVLLAGRRREPEGISWNGGRAVFRNLLGLAHGAGGIGMALLELYRATGEERFAHGAMQALRYEDGFFDEAAGGWPDLRHPALAAYLGTGRLHELRSALAEDRFARGTPGPGDGTWLHGAAGIALVRARFVAVAGLDVHRAAL
ncbi:MAG TPA: lanthionine synthetase LanC family protein, partial [Longimicrobium sp.]